MSSNTKRSRTFLVVAGGLGLGACILGSFCAFGVLNLGADVPANPRVQEVPTISLPPTGEQPVSAEQRDRDQPMAPATVTEADRRFTARFSEVSDALRDCGVPVVYACHRDRCTVAVHELDSAARWFGVRLKGWRTDIHPLVEDVLDLPPNSLPCSGLVNELVMLIESHRRYSSRARSPDGEVGCATVSLNAAPDDARRHTYEQGHDSRCDALTGSLDVVVEVGFAESRRRERESGD